MLTSLSLWVYGIVALGALGVYFLLPRADRSTRAAGALLGLAALAGLIVLGATRAAAGAEASAYFYIFAAIALICAVCVITQTRAVYSALYFVLVILAVAGLLVLLEAEFLAAALVIIYAGAILVTYVFVIMLASQSGTPLYDRRARSPLAACFAGFVLVAAVGGAMADYPASEARSGSQFSVAADGDEAESFGNTQSVGKMLMTRYVVVLELAGVLLLLAMVGAIAIARKKFPPSQSVLKHEALPVGEAGRSVAPF